MSCSKSAPVEERPDPTGGYGKKVTAVPCLQDIRSVSLSSAGISIG